MKKALLVSTAIVGGTLLAASPAAAQVELSISGYLDFQAGWASQDVDMFASGGNPDRGYDFITDTEIHFNFEGTADNGLRYGGKIELEADQGGTNNTDEARLHFVGDWGRLELGDEDGAEDRMYYDAGLTQSGSGGVDGDWSRWFVNTGSALTTADVTDSGDSTKVTYFTPRIAGFQGGVSFTPAITSEGQHRASDAPGTGGFENHVGLGANYVNTFNDVDVAIAVVGGFADSVNTGADDLGNWAVGGQVGYAGFSVAAGYVDNGDTRGFDDDWVWNIGAGYSSGPWSVGIGFLSAEASLGGNDDTYEHFTIQGAYSVAPGLRVYGDLSLVESEDGSDSSNDNDGTVFLMGTTVSF